MPKMNTLPFCLAGYLFCSLQCAGAQEPPCKATMTYENHNQVDPKPLKLHGINGRTNDEQGMPIPRVCVGIYSEKDHKLVATTETAEDGHFALGKLPPGRYRLVAKHEVLCSANVPLIVTSPQSRSKKELILHMNVAGIDKCSYGDLAVLQKPRPKPATVTADWMTASAGGAGLTRKSVSGGPCFRFLKAWGL
jgi:hypothetical protein